MVSYDLMMTIMAVLSSLSHVYAKEWPDDLIFKRFQSRIPKHSTIPKNSTIPSFAMKKYCLRGEPCYPTDADVDALTKELNPEMTRVLKWDGPPNPRVCAVPIGSPDDQPFYSWSNVPMKPVYYSLDFNFSNPCLSVGGDDRDICLSSMRNNPAIFSTPGFVVFALKAEHIQAAVRFAIKHNLCIMVAGTGHDFMTRHSCYDGILIRTTLMKDIEWDLDDRKGFGHEDGNVKFGPGIVFSEAHKSAADNNRHISSGWGITVGVAGWSMGGGHGPFAPSLGLGVDNILEVEVVTSNGALVKANAVTNKDLFWAIRGGGGSTWGVVTSYTLRAHKIPDGGIQIGFAQWSGNACAEGKKNLYNLLDSYTEWTLSLDKRWGGLSFLTPTKSIWWGCGMQWTWYLCYMFSGPKEEGLEAWEKLMDAAPGAEESGIEVANYWEYAVNYGLEPIIPVPYMFPTETRLGGISSVLISRNEVASGRVAMQMKKRIELCIETDTCDAYQIYHCVTGNIDSPRDPDVSIGDGFRNAIYHLVIGQDVSDMTDYYALGENSYFSESANAMTDDSWKQRYWGDNYKSLLAIKQQWDPNNIFWCYHCVGSDL